MTTARVFLLVSALALAACAAPARVAVPEPAVAAAPSPQAVAQPEPPRQADHLARIASELADLQNAVAKLMVGARQHDDQLLYLQRRLADMESQTRGRSNLPPGFAPSAGVSAPLPPPPMSPAPPPPALAPPTAPVPPAASMPPPATTLPPPAGPIPAPASSRIGASSSSPAVASRSTATPLRPPAGSSVSASSADALYQSGLAKYQAGELDAAVVTLYEVVANFPNDPARERAQLLVGEIFLAQKDYRGAVAELDSLIAAVPTSTRVPEALLKLGMAHRFLGDEPKARRAWERIVKEFPASGSARQARTLLKGARG